MKLILGLALAGAAMATPISYHIEFTETTSFGIVPVVSFDYDAAQANPFTNFNGKWDGVNFNLTNLANGNTDFNLSSACLGGQTGGQATFALLTNCPGAYWNGESFDNLTFLIFAAADGSVGIGGLIADVRGPNDRVLGAAVEVGTFRVVAGAVPEPSTFILMSVGLLLTGFAFRRKRGHLHTFSI